MIVVGNRIGEYFLSCREPKINVEFRPKKEKQHSVTVYLLSRAVCAVPFLPSFGIYTLGTQWYPISKKLYISITGISTFLDIPSFLEPRYSTTCLPIKEEIDGE